ncbi:MAG: ATP-dependent helicase C-terminal domain-containing protein [Sphingomonadaceae bacterium]
MTCLLLPPALLARAGHAGIAGLAPDALVETADLWLAPLLEGRRDLAVSKGKLTEALLNLLDWDVRAKGWTGWPRASRQPGGHARYRLRQSCRSSVEVRGCRRCSLDRHPLIGEGTPLLLADFPAGRPIQSTRDLPGFWRGSWRDVQREMKGRYPKHRWPDEPWTEKPSLKTKNAFSKSEG